MVLIRKKNLYNPLARGIFFAFALMITASCFACITIGCSNDKRANPKSPSSSSEKEGNFILLGTRGGVLEKSVGMMKESTDYPSNEDGIFNRMKIDSGEVQVEIDLDNIYASSYSDQRRVVCYPLKNLSLPQPGEKKPFCFLHYFDDKGMSIFFHVVVGLAEDTKPIEQTEPKLSDAPYQVWFLSPTGESYGLVRSRILDISDLSKDEAFNKFRRRTMLIGTNSLDENKFLFVFFKIESLPDKIFQIYLRWY